MQDKEEKWVNLWMEIGEKVLRFFEGNGFDEEDWRESKEDALDDYENED